jgi:hypothetical protein
VSGEDKELVRRHWGDGMRPLRERPWRFAIRFTLVMFALCTFLPIWNVVYIGPWETTGELGTFWGMLGSVPRATREFGLGWVHEHFWFEPVKLNVVLVVGLGVGRWLAGQQG